MAVYEPKSKLPSTFYPECIFDDVSQTIESQHHNFPFFDVWPKWMGWRVVECKVPSGYIDTITNGVDLDDY